MAAITAHEDLVIHYCLDKNTLFTLYDCIVSFLEEKGVILSYENLDPVVEIDIYATDRVFDEKEKHHESCLSDGQTVWLHDDLEDVGGITGRLYDILHVGCGHLYQ